MSPSPSSNRATVGIAALALLPALLAAPLGAAQSVQTLLLEGDSIPGASGFVDSVLDLAVTDTGDWIARVQMRDSTGTQEVVVLNGFVILAEQDLLFDPPGLRVDRFDHVGLSPNGTVWWQIDTDAATTADEILYRNLAAIAREGDPLFDSSLPDGTIWKDFDAFDLNDQGELLVLGDIDSPDLNGVSEAALVRQVFDDLGILVEEEVLVLEGDAIPGGFGKVLDIGVSSGGHDVAHSANHWIAFVRSDEGSALDGQILVDGQVVAQESVAGPLPGTFWRSLSPTGVGITNEGDYVFNASYDVIGGGELEGIFLNGAPLVVQGDTSASIAPHAFESFQFTSPVLLGENGSVVYAASTDNPDLTRDDGLFVGDRLVVQENVTPAGSETIGSILFSADSLDLAPEGRFLVFEATTASGSNGLFQVDLGLVREMESCFTTTGTLAQADGLPLLGETVTFEMDGEQDEGVTPVFLLSQQPILGWPPCGVMLPFGELLIDLSSGLGNPAIGLVGPPTDTSPVPFPVTVPNDPNLLGRNFYAQGLWWDAGNQSPAEDFRLTNGLEITLAPQ